MFDRAVVPQCDGAARLTGALSAWNYEISVTGRHFAEPVGAMRRIFTITSLTFAAAGLCACASAPTQQLTKSQSALRAAQEFGAPEYPDAAYHLKLAKDQIEEAKPLVDGSRKDKNRASMLLAQAELDAELALNLAQTREAQEEAEKAQAQVEQLKGEAQ